jgi:hypothetical protein
LQFWAVQCFLFKTPPVNFLGAMKQKQHKKNVFSAFSEFIFTTTFSTAPTGNTEYKPESLEKLSQSPLDGRFDLAQTLLKLMVRHFKNRQEEEESPQII